MYAPSPSDGARTAMPDRYSISEEPVSKMFDRAVSGDQTVADTLKAEVTGCYSFDIPRVSLYSGVSSARSAPPVRLFSEDVGS
jgi:hypothetical protein